MEWNTLFFLQIKLDLIWYVFHFYIFFSNQIMANHQKLDISMYLYNLSSIIPWNRSIPNPRFLFCSIWGKSMFFSFLLSGGVLVCCVGLGSPWIYGFPRFCSLINPWFISSSLLFCTHLGASTAEPGGGVTVHHDLFSMFCHIVVCMSLVNSGLLSLAVFSAPCRPPHLPCTSSRLPPPQLCRPAWRCLSLCS